MKKLFLAGIALAMCVSTNVMAQEECVAGQAVSAESITQATSDACCTKTGRAQNRCLRQALKRLNKGKQLLGSAVINEARASIRALRAASCNLGSVVVPLCDAEGSITVSEAIATADARACGLKFQDAREKRLKQMRRAANRAKRFLGSEFVAAVGDQMKGLERSRACGQGGEERSLACGGRLTNPRDGANGNVYKLSDHGGQPVFLGHNGARSGQVLTPQGKKITDLRYTGLANRDPNGLRHHYRIDMSCRSLPTPVILKIGSTCYEINDPCGRVD